MLSESTSSTRPRPFLDGESGHTASELTVAVRNLSKMYALYGKPNDRLWQSLWYALPRFLRSDHPPEFYKEFWALRDVSFEVKQGECVGIVGRNGSGKSTLLQIIAGTQTPTHGHVKVRGMVTALLELGSGFNPEFTGRENVYMNGAILGLKNEEIDDLFGDIVDFADIGQFIDQPVKLYSSGMYVRLAFAVQAFVPKEVLIVDEALAVGDEGFQRKCMRLLEQFRKNGGTVLLVSHDAQTIVRQCDRALLLSQGQLITDGASKDVTDLYHKLIYSSQKDVDRILKVLRQDGLRAALRSSPLAKNGTEIERSSDGTKTSGAMAKQSHQEPIDWFDPNLPKTEETTYGNGDAKILEYGIYNQHGTRVNVLVMSRCYTWTYRVRFQNEARNVQFGMLLKTKDGIDVAGLSSQREKVDFDYIPASSTIEVSFAMRLNILPGVYFLNAGVDGDVDQDRLYLHRRVDICMIRVIPCDTRESYGLAYLDPEFSYQFLQT